MIEDSVTEQHETIDRRRYGRITRFFARMIWHIIFWDLLMVRVVFVGRRVRGNRPNRYRLLSRKFTVLAADMGGVMIKLGQFLSTRVDVLPLEIVEELRALQDAVPPVPNAEIQGVIEAELGNIQTRFAEMETDPLAAASLGQTHRAWLKSDNGRRGAAVVIKVQRPGIERLVRTDLTALRTVAQWVMKYRPIRLRADVPALMEEFAVTMWEELDYSAEIANAERFRENFADYEGVYVPIFYPEHCTEHILVIENVESLKITDLVGMRMVGIETAEVADRLLDVYFTQVFEQAFFHADPHPGNIFIRPGAGKNSAGNTPFELIFIDFGMMGRISNDMITALQKILVSVTSRDAHGFIQTIDGLGFLLPSADLERMEEAHSQILDQIWGRDLLALSNPDMDEVKELTKQFKDLIFEFPFQIPQNFIYLGRAMGILSGLSSMLNPDINPWSYIETYGKRVATSRQAQSAGLALVIEKAKAYLALPAQTKRLLTELENGKLTLKFAPDRNTQKQLKRLEKRSRQTHLSILATATMLSGTLLYVNAEPTLGYTFWGLTTLITLWSIVR